MEFPTHCGSSRILPVVTSVFLLMSCSMTSVKENTDTVAIEKEATIVKVKNAILADKVEISALSTAQVSILLSRNYVVAAILVDDTGYRFKHIGKVYYGPSVWY